MDPWTASDYLLEGDTDAEEAFQMVWGHDFSKPGFCLLDLGTDMDSSTLRSRMISLKNRLSKAAGHPFVCKSMGRFDQQETTKFHLDGAPAESLLMLGYEPTNVHSRLFLADYTRAACVLGIEPKQFLDDFNPMFRKGEDVLSRYVKELPQPAEGHARILLINNSWLPFSNDRKNPLGVMHKAEIVNPDEVENRIVNSFGTWTLPDFGANTKRGGYTANLARIISSKKASRFSSAHNLTVQETVLKALGIVLSKLNAGLFISWRLFQARSINLALFQGMDVGSGKSDSVR